MVHGAGSNPGLVVFNKQIMYPRDFIDALLESKILPEDTKEVKLLSCFGGYIVPFTHPLGFRVSSIHEYKESVLIQRIEEDHLVICGASETKKLNILQKITLILPRKWMFRIMNKILKINENSPLVIIAHDMTN